MFSIVIPAHNEENYIVNHIITRPVHGNPSNCKAIDMKAGIKRHEESKNQQKTKSKTIAIAVSKNHKQTKSVQNLNAYQTQHKDSQVQQQREQTASQIGLPGHHSQNSSANMNSGTSSALSKINKK